MITRIRVLAGDARSHPEFYVARGEQAPRTLELDGGFATREGAVLNKLGYLVPGFSFEEDYPRNERPGPISSPLLGAQAGWVRPRIHRVAGSLIVVTSRHQRNYFHWMLDVLPRVALGRRVAPAAPVYAETVHGFQRECLIAAGIHWVEASEAFTVEADRLVVPSLPEAFLRLARWAVEGAREVLRPFLVGGMANPGSRLLYLSRRDAAWRRVVDEDRLFETVLEPLGFVRVALNGLSLREQADLFRGADVIVGAHGAGLANLLFARPGTRVLELFARGYAPPSFYDLAEHVGAQYLGLIGTGPEPQESFWPHQKDDIHITAQALGTALERLLGSESALSPTPSGS